MKRLPQKGVSQRREARAFIPGSVNPARCAGRFFLGLDIGPTRTI